MPIDKDRWDVISPLLDRLLEADADRQATMLEAIRADDADLADELQRLLAQQTSIDREGFLEGKALAEATTLTGHVVGAYTIDRAIGSGGMGNVWLAHRSDGRFEGDVAVKFLNLAAMGRGGVERFEREGRLLARLAHPHIARLVDAGLVGGGQPYLILEYVEGAAIDVWCDSRSLSIEERLRLFLDVLDAVAYAHNNLILHRDLKPSNILVTPDGEAKLLDFGIARLVSDDTSTDATALTQFAGLAFTPAYAAPEQVEGKTVTTATDVYALGVLLYVLLTGRHPTSAPDASGIDRLRSVLDTQPPRLGEAVGDDQAVAASRRVPSPRRLAALLRGDLDRIVAKALKKRPDERYATAAELAADLRRHLANEPVHAVADSLRYRAAKFVRRNQFGVGATALIALALCVGVATTFWQGRVAQHERDRALAQLDRAEAISEFLTFLLDEASLSGKPFTSEQLLDRGERMARLAFPKDPGLRAELLLKLGEENIARMRTGRARDLLKQSHELAQRLDDPSLKARAACAYAKELADAGNVDEAGALMKDALRQLPEQTMEIGSRVNCLIYSVQIANVLGKSDDALADSADVARFVARLPTASPLLRQEADATIGQALQIAGRYPEAAERYRSAVEVLKSMGAEESMQMMVILNNLSVSLYTSGRPEEAANILAGAFGIAGGPDANGDLPAYVTASYGRALLNLDRFDDARAMLSRSVTSAARDGDQIQVLKSRRGLVMADIALGRLDEAAREQATVEDLIGRLLPPNHPVWGLAYDNRARLSLARGETARALSEADRGIAIERSAPVLVDDLSKTLMLRSAIKLALHRPDEAQVDAIDALDIARKVKVGDAPSYLVGQGYLALGRTLLALDRKPAADDALRSAVANIEVTAGAQHPDAQAARSLLIH